MNIQPLQRSTRSLAHRPSPPSRRSLPAALSAFSTVSMALLLAACGGGSDGGAGSSATAAAASGQSQPLGGASNDAAAAAASTSTSTGSASSTGSTATTTATTATTATPADSKTATTTAATDRPATLYEASRFLTQATFGPLRDDAELVMKLGYGAWIDRQFTLPATSNRSYWEAADAAVKAVTPTASAGQDQVWESFWKQAATSPDQLRLRVAYALSQIFVISAVDGNVGNEPRALAAWLDMLETDGLTTYRALLEKVSLHPLMGMYLTSLHNQKADSTGRVPDQNYAREVMQLFTIGLVKLNADGSPALASGKPVDTYTPDDVAGMAKVFTGWSWACPAAPNSNCFYNGSSGGVSDPDRAFKPMVAYPAYHSTEAKTFLGVTVAAQASANPAASLKVALDTLANHPNVGPFIGRQLIQRLITSNPSPAYVAAVAAVFADNGSGVRGDMKAVVKAILTHPEAKLQTNATGKLREPVLRLSAYLRAFPHSSDTGSWKVGNTDAAATSLGQTPLRAGSVFNFYRPGYVAPLSQSAAAGLVAPELQLLNESSVSGWVNYMRDNLASGVGQYNGTVGTTVFNRRDLQHDWTPELALAARSTELVSQITDKLLYGLATDALRTEISGAINKITIPALNSGGTNQAAIDAAKFNRVKAAVLLTLASPEFLVQK